MRTLNIGRWIDRHDRSLTTELYRPGRRYDVVVFVKTMDEHARREAERIQAYGGRVVFDANVNYYEIWGEYDIPGTKPTAEQQRDAVEMTQLADWVVADSSYLLEIVSKHTDSASWIPDNVDTRLFRPGWRRNRRGPLRLVWSGMAHKARHLLLVRDELAAVAELELMVVSNERPEALAELAPAVRCRFARFSLRRYARLLRSCDVIVSPKRLGNGYELGHSEWKITLGMAAALPAVASPQRSYQEAIGHRQGGVIAESPAEWRAALERLRDDAEHRRELGRRAVETVRERYATPVVAPQYRDLLCSLS